ncbi:MAG TPA: hypothetical protein VMB49_00240 [Acidobacteriaceae bacterium]|nr:hypothetical protein [Acidobacteriaceae bacterium]
MVDSPASASKRSEEKKEGQEKSEESNQEIARAWTEKARTVFLNIPYDKQFEDLYVAYIVGLTQLGLDVTATLAHPNQDRQDHRID